MKPKKTHRIDANDHRAIEIRKFRDSHAWRQKREQIQKRDLHLCQVCMRKLYNTINQYTHDNTSVHHIIALTEDMSKRMEDSNLITLCSMHHAYADDGYIPAQLLMEINREK